MAAGRLSFSLYLVQFPLLFTVVCSLFLNLREFLPYRPAVVVCTGVGISMSLALTLVFERWIDRPAIRLSRIMGAVRFPGGPGGRL